MISREEWLDPEEWLALGASEAHVYQDLADSCALDINDCCNGRTLDFLYRTHVDSVWTLPIEIPKRAALPSRRQIRNAKAAQEANRQRGIRTLQAVKQAWQKLRCPQRPTPSTKEVARLASTLMGRTNNPMSLRQTSRCIFQLRASGDIL